MTKKSSTRRFWLLNFFVTAFYVIVVLALYHTYRMPDYAMYVASVGLILILILTNGYDENDGFFASWIS